MQLTGKITEYDADGRGLLVTDERVVAINGTVVGDSVTVDGWYKKKKQKIAKEWVLLSPSADRVMPVCDHFGQIGSCSMQHINYDAQLKFKAVEIFKYTNLQVEVAPSPKKTNYRNRADVAVTQNGIGFRQAGSWWKVIDVEECILFSENLGKYIRELKHFMSELNLTPRNTRDDSGDIRYLTIREGSFTGQTQINLLTSNATDLTQIDLSKYFSADSVYWSVQAGSSDISTGEVKKIFGLDQITEKLLDVNYLIHPNGFFQTNSYQAQNLLAYVCDLAVGQSVLDLYCGAGTFALQLTKRGLRSAGYDNNAFSIEMARKNAALNDLNVNFEVKEDRDLNTIGEFDSVIVDPPRAGLHANLIETLLAAKPKQLIYVSCNPKSLGRDLEMLKTAFDVVSAKGYDMFPHTPHVESVVELIRK